MEVESIPSTASLGQVVIRSKKRTRELYAYNLGSKIEDKISGKLLLGVKLNDDYAHVRNLPAVQTISSAVESIKSTAVVALPSDDQEQLPPQPQIQQTSGAIGSQRQTPTQTTHGIVAYQNTAALAERIKPPSSALMIRSDAPEKPEWHAPWKLMRVISGHLGWVRSVAVDSSNEWFATGSADRTIKIWDLATGTLKLTLTGHINAVRGLAVSPRHPYLFSCGEDKMIKCWDLEQNKVVRNYHGHLSGVYSLALHPTIDVLVTGGRDSTARVWDMRTMNCIHTLSGHTSTVGAVACQSTDPQVITGSQDSTIRLWDLAKGSCTATLTHHKKSIRALVLHPTEYSMASGAPDNIKVWKFPEGKFMRNLSGHRSILHTLAINNDNVLVSGADNGSMYFWDWKSGYNFQKIQTTAQPGSLESESGIFALTFDQTGSRLISCEADKTIKIYKEDGMLALSLRY
jgi:pleiotropic regulator 1